MPNYHVFLWTLSASPSQPLFQALCERFDHSSPDAWGASDAELIYATPAAWLGRDLRELQGNRHIFILPEHIDTHKDAEACQLMVRMYQFLSEREEVIHVWNEQAASLEPELHLRHLCIALNIPFSWRMLNGFGHVQEQDSFAPHATMMAWEVALEDGMNDPYSEWLEPLFWHALLQAPAPALSPEPALALTA